jgi:hypothetical protein
VDAEIVFGIAGHTSDFSRPQVASRGHRVVAREFLRQRGNGGFAESAARKQCRFPA